jgi:hypothetical protein
MQFYRKKKIGAITPYLGCRIQSEAQKYNHKDATKLVSRILVQCMRNKPYNGKGVLQVSH